MNPIEFHLHKKNKHIYIYVYIYTLFEVPLSGERVFASLKITHKNHGSGSPEFAEVLLDASSASREESLW